MRLDLTFYGGRGAGVSSGAGRKDNASMSPKAMEIIELYNIGATYYNEDKPWEAKERLDNDIDDILSSHGYGMFDADRTAADALYAGSKYGNEIKPVEKTYFRYGDIRKNSEGALMNSINFAEGKSELGVSVATRQWTTTISSRFFSGTIYSFKGVQIAIGSDGEPLVKATSKPIKTKFRSITKALASVGE